MRGLGYGRDYVYSHDDYAAGQSFLPENVAGHAYYVPGEHGAEAATALERAKKGRPE